MDKEILFIKDILKSDKNSEYAQGPLSKMTYGLEVMQPS